MIDTKDERWLKKALNECFESRSKKVSKDRQLLEGFSMLVRYAAQNMKDNLDKTRALWEEDPASKELREKFDSLANCLSYLERYCREKIDREFPKHKKSD